MRSARQASRSRSTRRTHQAKDKADVRVLVVIVAQEGVPRGGEGEGEGGCLGLAGARSRSRSRSHGQRQARTRLEEGLHAPASFQAPTLVSPQIRSVRRNAQQVDGDDVGLVSSPAHRVSFRRQAFVLFEVGTLVLKGQGLAFLRTYNIACHVCTTLIGMRFKRSFSDRSKIKEEKQIIGNVTFVLQNQKDEAF